MATEYEILDEAPDYVSDVAGLADWSQNFNDSPTQSRPFALFLDIIGWSEENFGQTLFDLSKVGNTFGYLEIGKLADALRQYADRPQDVEAWLETLMNTDS